MSDSIYLLAPGDKLIQMSEESYLLEADLQKLLSMACKDRVIDNLDHTVVRRLMGEF